MVSLFSDFFPKNIYMKVLVTGSAGFIGYHLTLSLLKDGYQVCGVDNINDYYSTKLKLNRLDRLKSINNFSFSKINICDFNSLEKIFLNFRPDKVVNLAAQAGVRYSLENPKAYMNSNIDGFFNIIELCKQFNVKGLVYASSSSVYGGNTKIPFSVEDDINNPISLYAATKASNELIANSYSHLYDLNTTGLRYFTVYGPWGRPDMAMYIFTKNIIDGHPISVYNNGLMKRDFTYIDDIIAGTKSAIKKNYSCEIFNLGNNKSVELMDMIAVIEDTIDKKAKINYESIQLGDVKETFADIDKTQKMLEYFPKTNINTGIKKFVEWYMNYKEKC